MIDYCIYRVMYTYDVYDDVPICFTATAEKDTLNEEFKNLDWFDHHKKLARKHKKDKYGFFVKGSLHSSCYYTPFGWSSGKYDHRQYKLGEFWTKKYDGCDPYSHRRHGIEIKWTTPSKQTIDGKFKYDKITVKELKEACKRNGFTKLPNKKLELVKLLMKV